MEFVINVLNHNFLRIKFYELKIIPILYPDLTNQVDLWVVLLMNVRKVNCNMGRREAEEE